jgi:hypothetical protein
MSTNTKLSEFNITGFSKLEVDLNQQSFTVDFSVMAWVTYLSEIMS